MNKDKLLVVGLIGLLTGFAIFTVLDATTLYEKTEKELTCSVNETVIESSNPDNNSKACIPLEDQSQHYSNKACWMPETDYSNNSCSVNSSG